MLKANTTLPFTEMNHKSVAEMATSLCKSIRERIFNVNVVSLARLSIILTILLLNYTVYRSKLLISKSCQVKVEKFHLSDTYQMPKYQTKTTSKMKLCVITRIYGPQLGYFPVFASSLLHNTEIHIRILVVNTDKHTDLSLLSSTIDFINELSNQVDAVRLLDFGSPPSVNTYGYHGTDQALRYLYNEYENRNNICDYLTVTNGDNLYSNDFGKTILPHMQNRIEMIAWTFSSHYFTPYFVDDIPTDSYNAQVEDGGTDKCARAWYIVGYLDLSAAAYRFDFLYKYKLLFHRDEAPYEAMSDSFFAIKAANLSDSWIVLRQALIIHQ